MYSNPLSPSLFLLTVLGASFFRPSSADQNSICRSLGVDFEDGGSYFINTGSKDSVTIASQFEGCNPGFVNVLLIGPLGDRGDEFDCSDVQTTPNDVTQISTCPVTKDRLVSGQYLIVLFGNNGDSDYPFSAQRNITLRCGIPVTETITPTITWNETITPVQTITETSTVSITSTFDATTTITVPSATGRRTRTVTPKAATTTIVKTVSHTKRIFTWDRKVVTETKAASCRLPQKPTKVDPPCRYKPTKSHSAWAHWTAQPKVNIARNADGQFDAGDDYIRGAIQRARERRARRRDVAVVQGGADQPTVTVTASNAETTTSTFTAPPITEGDVQLTTVTVSTTLSPSTVYSGIQIPTVTAPQPTKTRYSVTVKEVKVTKSTKVLWTKTVFTTPAASASACRKEGGWFSHGSRGGR